MILQRLQINSSRRIYKWLPPFLVLLVGLILRLRPWRLNETSLDLWSDEATQGMMQQTYDERA